MKDQSAVEAAPPALGRPIIALIGNPNTGKTSLFNALCGARQRVGNYPGVTVEKKVGVAELPGVGPVEIVDLPGLYSLKAISPDEETAVNAAMGRIPGQRRPDLLLFILDATNLKRNLFLFSQAAELGLPMAVALTMTDLLGPARIELDIPALEAQLGAPVAPIEGRNRERLDGLLEVLARALNTRGRPGPAIGFAPKVEAAAEQLQSALAPRTELSRFEARELLYQQRLPWLQELAALPDVADHVERARAAVNDPVELSPASAPVRRYAWADRVVAAVERRSGGRSFPFTEKLDRILTHRVLGLAAFAGVMYLIFRAIYAWAAPLMDGIEFLFSALGAWAGAGLGATPMLQSLVIDGVIAGVGSVVVFLPQIVILFVLIAFLEDSGYLARAAFLMDRLLGWTGLNGRAFIPMLSSFACAIPGIMATRVIPDQKARMTTILVAPLMSCSARLPVYLLLIGAFIEPHFGPGIAALTLFAMHAFGLLVALPIAWVLNRGFLKSASTPFLLEMPPYRMPHLFDVLYRAYEAASKFLIRAGTVIFALSIVIWALSYFPRSESVAREIDAKYAPQIAAALAAGDAAAAQSLELDRDHVLEGAYLEQSYLGRLGKTVEPAFRPLGFDWKISVGILGAFPAREVIISTLGIVYNVGADADEESQDLKSRMAAAQHPDGRAVFTPLTAITLMIFFALCSQCMSTLATVQRELNSWKWTLFLFSYMTGLAYLFGLAVYQGGRALGFA